MGITIALLYSLGMCAVRTRSVRVNIVFTKRRFNLSAEAIINVRNARLCTRCPIFHLKVKQILFSSYVFEEIPESIQEVIGDVYCPGKHCFNRMKCESFEGYVTTPRSIHDFANGGAWLFVRRILFTLQGLVKTTKRQSTLLLC